jgi:dipeptidyl aminopeptidase/acylaminoacyl peptidase
MFDFFRPTHPFGGQTLRLVAEAQHGGGDVFDIARICHGIEEGDTDGWERAWVAAAEAAEAKAHDALAAGRKHTARQFFWHANQYWRMSDVFLTAPDLDKKAERFLKSQANFRAGAALSTPPIEVISVRCGDEAYDGYFCHPVDPAPGKWPAVFLIGGAEAFAEEIFYSGRQVLERGWALLLVDTPGRGSSSYVKRIPTRPDYEVPVAACLDYLEARPEIDADRMALIGISMAGYYAPRAAAFDARVKALVGWCGCYSLLDDLYIFCEHLRPTLQRLLGGVSDAEARVLLADFTMAGAAGNITCPTLITHGAADRLMSVDGARRLFDEIASPDKTLKIYDDEAAGGVIHCSHDHWAHNVPFMLDWLEERL